MDACALPNFLILFRHVCMTEIPCPTIAANSAGSILLLIEEPGASKIISCLNSYVEAHKTHRYSCRKNMYAPRVLFRNFGKGQKYKLINL